MYFVYKCTILVLTIKIINCAILPDCPSLMYSSSDDGFFYANLDVPSPYNHNNIIKFHVKLSIIGNKVLSEEITKDFFLGTADDVLYNRQLPFSIQLPSRWNDFQKKITQITINDETYCISQQLVAGNTNEINRSQMFSIRVTSNDVTKEPLDVTPTSVTRRPIQNSPRTRPVQHYPQTTAKSINQNPQSNDCYQSLQSTGLIAHGEDVESGMYPWVGAIVKKNSGAKGVMHQCGATLLTEKLVLTGHCIDSQPIQEYLLIFGTTDIDDIVNPEVQIRTIKSHTVHSDYNMNNSDADLAILELSKKVEISVVVRPICLCSSEADCFENISVQRGVVAGWGKTENDQVSRTLKKIYTSMVDEEECLRSHDVFIDITSHRTFCAGDRNGTGPCAGDSGSGFYMFIRGMWTIRGVVSRSARGSDGRCDLNQYIVYVDVAKHLDWIKNCIDNNNVC